jgi:ribosomal protein S18 acetylase RimI-like enzyme
MKKLPVRLRNMQPEDKNFILNSWLKSYRKSPAVRRMENNAYFHEQSKVIKEMLDNVNVLIACDEKDSTQILGYLVSQRIDNVFIVHYLYTKLPFRNCGIGKMLIRARDHDLGDVAACYTHHTDTANRLAYKYKFMHNPYITSYFKEFVQGDIDYAAVES